MYTKHKRNAMLLSVDINVFTQNVLDLLQHKRFANFVTSCFKGACSDPQPHPPTFFKNIEILVAKVELYLEGFVCEILCAKSV